jgi:hypothetical protein
MLFLHYYAKFKLLNELTLRCLPIFRPKERNQTRNEEDVRNNYPNSDFGFPPTGSTPFIGQM